MGLPADQLFSQEERMTRKSLILSISALTLGVAACGGYDEKNAAYDAGNAAYDENGAAYESNGAADYDSSANAAYNAADGNTAYPPPVNGNESTNGIGAPPPADPTTNGY
jgi:hypothetical protein